MTVAHYRAMASDGKGIVTQGTFTGVEDVKNYLVRRGLDDGAVLRLEREHNGEWMFEQNFVVPEKEEAAHC